MDKDEPKRRSEPHPGYDVQCLLILWALNEGVSLMENKTEEAQ